jgi:hypothetical protein
VIYPAQSQLQGDITATATSITLVSAAGFTAPCYVVLTSEILYCPTGPTGNEFAGVTRAALNTTAAAHTSETGVYGLYSASYSFGAMGDLGGFWDQIAAELATVQARLAAASGGGPTTQIAYGTDRFVNTVYQNATGKPMWVTTSVSNPSGNGILFQTDANNPPNTTVALLFDALQAQNVSFTVLAGNFYWLNAPDPTGIGINSWTEWF